MREPRPLPGERVGALRAPGSVVLVSTYELGHQPLSLASPLALLEQSGFHPAIIDLAVERFKEQRASTSGLVGLHHAK